MTEKTVKLILIHASVDSLNSLNSVNSVPFRENSIELFVYEVLLIKYSVVESSKLHTNVYIKLSVCEQWTVEFGTEFFMITNSADPRSVRSDRFRSETYRLTRKSCPKRRTARGVACLRGSIPCPALSWGGDTPCLV